MFAIAMALTGALVTYSQGNEIGRERFQDDGKTLHSEIALSGRNSR